VSTTVAVFSRAPVAGAAKRRLIPALGAEGSARLQARMTRHAVAAAHAAGLGPLRLWCTPDSEHPLFTDLAATFGAGLEVQRGADLGERMHHAIERGLGESEAVLLLGTDCPALDAAALAEAAALLAVHDAVLGAARDGGYVMIGLRAADEAVFRGVRWGTERVLAQTRSRLRALEWRWAELGPFHDIDRPEDLAHLPSAWGSPPAGGGEGSGLIR
jgi:rSAM/selenodomain-associated transferase 1